MMRSVRLAGVAGCLLALALLRPAWPAGDPGGRQLRIHLAPATAANGSAAHGAKERPKAHVVSVKELGRTEASRPRRRSRELSWQEIVVVALDQAGREIDRVVVPDPRLIRYEATDPSGNFVESDILYREEADFTAVFREGPGLRTIKVYQPRWTGSGYALDLVGTTVLPWAAPGRGE